MARESDSILFPLDKSFYAFSPYQLARKLIGTIIVRIIGGSRMTARIVETEAYGGSEDPASHAYRGMTERNRVMFNAGGYSYVYFTYGMHFCFNVVAGKSGTAGAVLIRAAEPIEGIDKMKLNRNKERLLDLLSGPAKLCQALAIDKSLNGLYLDTPHLFIAAWTKPPARTSASARIGIQTGREKQWRFCESDCAFVSKK